MSGRSFRERYGSLAQPESVTDATPCPEQGWPTPAGARLVDSAFGPCSVMEQVYAGDAIRAARSQIDDCCHQSGEHGSAEGLLFLDTETTGLSGGTGTHVFLVGVGQFSGSSFVTRQFFMRHPGDERAMLATLSDTLHDIGALVTYNGRSFDVPLLETRFRMHARELHLPPAHIDLLSPARAIWKHRLPSCSLGTIERQILGVVRTNDAPGWLIPQLYFDYLRHRRVETLDSVFEHNRLDIVSLARATGIVRSYELGIARPEHPIDSLALALYRLRRHGSPNAATEIQACWTTASIPADLRLRGLQSLSIWLKRQRRHDEAAIEWYRGLSDPSRIIRLYAAEELAKFLEHHARDHEKARDIARRGADGAALANDALALAAFERRLQRLERKLSRGPRILASEEKGYL